MKRSTLTGEEIKTLRHQLKLKQRECANIIGVGIRQWQKYEAGDQPCKQLYIDVLKARAN